SLDRPEQRIAVDEGPDLAHEVAAARLLDLDDLGALLTEQARAERRRDSGAQIEDTKALERTGHDRPCSFLTASMPPALRASTFASALGVFDPNCSSITWKRHDSSCHMRSVM